MGIVGIVAGVTWYMKTRKARADSNQSPDDLVGDVELQNGPNDGTVAEGDREQKGNSGVAKQATAVPKPEPPVLTIDSSGGADAIRSS